MSKRHLLLTLGLASYLAAAPLTAQQAGPRLSVPYQTFTLPNGLTVILHEDHSVPGGVRQRVVPRRLGEREARPHRVRAPLRAPDVRRARGT